MERQTTVISQEELNRQSAICHEIASYWNAQGRTPLAFVDTYGCQQNEADSEKLRGMAAALNTELQIGKSGITENVVRQAEEALAARELIKGRVLDNSLLSAREACDALCEACGADGVQVIGSKFVLFKQNEKDPKIVLINDRKGKK